MEENKTQKVQKAEDKIEFDIEAEVEKSAILESFSAAARLVIENGYRGKSYSLECVTKIGDKRHTRLETLSPKRDQFLIKFLEENKTTNKVESYEGTFEVRKSTESGRIFYCWIINFAENYKKPMLADKGEREYLQAFVPLLKKYIAKEEAK